jgi:hypothetical protein
MERIELDDKINELLGGTVPLRWSEDLNLMEAAETRLHERDMFERYAEVLAELNGGHTTALAKAAGAEAIVRARAFIEVWTTKETK